MGSATREAVTALRDVLAQQGKAADLKTAEDLFAVSGLLVGSAQLRRAIADASAEGAATRSNARQSAAATASPLPVAAAMRPVSRWCHANSPSPALYASRPMPIINSTRGFARHPTKAIAPVRA